MGWRIEYRGKINQMRAEQTGLQNIPNYMQACTLYLALAFTFATLFRNCLTTTSFCTAPAVRVEFVAIITSHKVSQNITLFGEV